ncbi:MAG TPA: GNAT family protein [Burkholderiaceae bacterium]|jgi:RimJ/RimL family protein N-acetyltransferase
MAFTEPVTLRGEHATLEPLSVTHHDDLVAAASDGELWKLWYTTVPRPESMRAEIERRLDCQSKGTWLPFVIRRNDTGAISGMTNYLNIDANSRRVEIGGTWNAKSTQRTGVNTECKLMLLTHAFETLKCPAVEFRTHFMNHQSREAIARLGAKQDGILRNHMLIPGVGYRDTVVFSIIESEWPTIRHHLRYKLGR